MRDPDSHSSSPPSSSPASSAFWPAAGAPPRVPAWALPRDASSSEADAAFCAGAALTCLDAVVAAASAFRGAFGQRLALKSAAAAVKRCGRAEDESALRDAWYLRKLGDAPGPAGQVLSAWRQLAARPPTIDADRLRTIADFLSVRWSTELAAVPDRVEALARRAMPPFAAAAILREIVTLRPDAELLAIFLADLVLSRCMRWAVGVPLLLVGPDGPALFRGGGGRGGHGGGGVQGGEDGNRAVCRAVASGAREACRCAADMARRAARLTYAAPKLRAKGAGEAISLLLDEDAVPGALKTVRLSRFASRRLFERLVALEAVRELTGRPHFRLYGL